MKAATTAKQLEDLDGLIAEVVAGQVRGEPVGEVLAGIRAKLSYF